MTVLVTGGAGYIGSHVVLALADRGTPVIVLDNLSAGFRQAIPENVALIVGDVGDTDLVSRITRQHHIKAYMHFAASVVVPDSVKSPTAYYKNNTSNTLALIGVAEREGVKQIIFSSTAAVYGNPDIASVTEDVTPSPLSPYGMSKLMAERMLSDSASAGDMRYVALRYFNVAGADPELRTGQSSPSATHLIKVAVQTALGVRNSMEIFGADYPTEDGTCIRDYIHVSDLAAAHLSALTYLQNGGASTTLNCGYGRGYSVRDVIDSVKRVSGKEFPVVLRDRRAGDPAGIVADNARIRRTLSWEPKYADLDTIVCHALAWERKLIERNLSVN